MAPTPPSPVVRTSRGAVRGTSADGVDAFRGIPYAEAPVGILRFAPPEPRGPWEGERDATAYGPTCAKPGYTGVFEELMDEPRILGDDLLNLNVWTPAERAPDAALPVFVWIHGGAFRNGSGASEVYDCSAFARDGVVGVTLNYRLGMDGFGLVPDAPANRGLLDQVAALEWVRDEIAAFGGDPDRVTIAGESAGGMSVATLLAMPRAAGLFRRAIAQSGAGHHVQTRETAERVAAVLGERLGVAPTAEGFLGVDLDAFVAAQTELGTEISGAARADWGALGLDSMAYEPVLDGDVIPARPIDALVADPRPDVDVLVGWTAEEYRFWLVPLGVTPHLRDEHVDTAARTFGLPEDRLAPYRALPTPADGFEALVCDWCFRIPAVRLAEARSGGSTHVYEFAWRSPALTEQGGLGACHTMEISFAFDTTRTAGARPMVGPEPPRALADEVHAAWVAFATHGDPGWAPYDPDRRAVRRFDDGAPGLVVDDPDAERRRAWDGLR